MVKKSYKSLFLSTGILMGILGTNFSEHPMKLINDKTKQVVIEFNEKETIIHDRFLKKAMETKGIVIPPALRDTFGGKERIFLKDPEFQKAFKEVFYAISMNPNHYHWEETL